MPLPQIVRETCLDIMKNVMKRPCASLFLEPVNPDRDGAPNYYAVVKKPVDLGSIYKKLENDEYTSVAAWNRDMSLVWGNAEKFNGRESFIGLIAFEIKRNYDREYRKIRILTMQKWIQTVSDLKDQLDDLLDSPPDTITKYATISERPDPNQAKPFTDDDIDQLIRSSMYLSSKQDAKKMLHIIRLCEPHYPGPDEKNRIDVSSLSSSTLHTLKDYVFQRLQDLGIQIPK